MAMHTKQVPVTVTQQIMTCDGTFKTAGLIRTCLNEFKFPVSDAVVSIKAPGWVRVDLAVLPYNGEEGGKQKTLHFCEICSKHVDERLARVLAPVSG